MTRISVNQQLRWSNCYSYVPTVPNLCFKENFTGKLIAYPRIASLEFDCYIHDGVKTKIIQMTKEFQIFADIFMM